MASANAKHRSLNRHRIDVRKCRQPQAVTQFLDYIQTPPMIPWIFGVGQHAELVTQWLQTGAFQCFTPDRQLPRQRYLSDNTWHAIQVRKQLQTLHRFAHKHRQKLIVKKMLHSWSLAYRKKILGSQPAQVATDNAWVSAMTSAEQSLRQVTIWTLHLRRQLHPIARQWSRNDRLHSLENLVHQFHEASHTHDSHRIYKTLKPLLGQTHRRQFQGFRPIPAVKLDDGTLASDADTAVERWRSYFAEPETGFPITPSALQMLAQEQAIRYDRSDVVFDISSVPSLLDIESYILRARPNKAPGIDGLPADIYRLDVPAMARTLWPLIAKCSIRCTEPLRWRGGAIFPLPKTNSAGHSPEKYRSILLADFSSKVSHGILRGKLLPAFQTFRQPMQLGGVPGHSTDMLNLFVQSFAHMNRTQGVSSASVFLDIRQAFYRACRPLIVNRPTYEEDLAQFFLHQGWGPELS